MRITCSFSHVEVSRSWCECTIVTGEERWREIGQCGLKHGSTELTNSRVSQCSDVTLIHNDALSTRKRTGREILWVPNTKKRKEKGGRGRSCGLLHSEETKAPDRMLNLTLRLISAAFSAASYLTKTHPYSAVHVPEYSPLPYFLSHSLPLAQTELCIVKQTELLEPAAVWADSIAVAWHLLSPLPRSASIV